MYDRIQILFSTSSITGITVLIHNAAHYRATDESTYAGRIATYEISFPKHERYRINY